MRVPPGLQRAGEPDPARFLAELGRALRLHGVGVTLRDELDAGEALGHVDRGDEAEVRMALRIALRIPREAWQAYDRLFAACWRGVPSLPSSSPPPRRPATDRPAVRGRLLAWDPDRRQMSGEEPSTAPEGDEPGWSPEALLRRKAFDRGDWSPAEIAAVERLLARLARRLANRRSRRLVPTRGRGLPDLRASFRRALATAGEPLALARRARARDRPKLILLCDTSGSMDACGRFLLAFVLALGRAVPGAHAFAFNTDLVHLTAGGAPALVPGKVALTLERLAAAVPDWSGGTRIGDCLSLFSTQNSSLLDGATTVVVLSDGLDRGDPALLADAVRRIRSRARRLLWLNPLAGDPRYAPTAGGMAAALPYVDHFAAAHDVASLERLLPQLAR